MDAGHRWLRHREQQEVQPFLLSGRPGPSLHGGRSAVELDQSFPLRLPASSANFSSANQTGSRAAQMHLNHPMVASEAMVSGIVTNVSTQVHSCSREFTSTGCSQHPQRLLEVDGVAHNINFSEPVAEILKNTRKLSTRKSYARKWQCYMNFLSSRSTAVSSLSSIFDFLLSLRVGGLSFSSVRVYMAAVLACHPLIDGLTVFSHPSSKSFLKGLRNSFPLQRPPPPAWDLPTVLCALTRRPFEPMAFCDLRLLSWKMAFLVAITSARRVSELAALRRVPPYLVFLPHAVRLRPNIRFLPKVVSDFHLSADIMLPDFYPSPTSPEQRLWHTLDVRRALLFYLHRTSFPGGEDSLFLGYSGRYARWTISSQRLSRWVTATIELSYALQKLPAPPRVTAHSTRVVATSVALLHGVSLQDICTAATWASPNTFICQYAIDARARRCAPVARPALSTISG